MPGDQWTLLADLPKARVQQPNTFARIQARLYGLEEANILVVNAFERGDLPIIKELVRHNHTYTDDMLGLAIMNNHIKVIKYLMIYRDASQDSVNFAFCAAASYNNLRVLRCLNNKYLISIKTQRQAISGAIVFGHLRVLRWLVPIISKNPEVTSLELDTDHIFIAAEKGFLKLVRFLFKQT